MPRPRTAVAAFALGRLAFGAGLLARPEAIASGWLGGDAERPPVQIALRGLGARDIALSAGTLASLGDERKLVPWLAAAVLSDVADVASTLVTPADALPRNARWRTVALAGASAGAGVALIAALAR
jgi:hypothetical protein